MYINVENLGELCGKHNELEILRKITANHGEESEISLLCEVIAKLYQKVDKLLAGLKPETETETETETEKKPETLNNPRSSSLRNR